MESNTIYTCKGKGGMYELVGIAKGDGVYSNFTNIVVYMDRKTGQLYFRSEDDFNNRMEKLNV